MPPSTFFSQVGNQFMKATLRSPLHRLLSGGLALITVTGRKSGKPYTTPVNYLRRGDRLSIVSFRSRTWWRNLRGGAPVTLRLQGEDVKGWATVVEDYPAVAAALTDHLRQAPQYAKYLAVALDPTGQPQADDIAAAAQTRVVVHVKLD
jgi:deazaflavin-dependent oxidoreductase (nitroreductase family)